MKEFEILTATLLIPLVCAGLPTLIGFLYIVLFKMEHKQTEVQDDG